MQNDLLTLSGEKIIKKLFTATFQIYLKIIYSTLCNIVLFWKGSTFHEV
jgi:hypothetical protein